MINSPETYRHAGAMHGNAVRNHDIGLRNQWAQWARAAFKLELSAADALLAVDTFHAAHLAAFRGMPA